ncbi:hypothetical protein PICMEDRAFT_15513 [Pichia membranifaciens NRRL Y-2026]|uniref:Uncharacterized protein n=1 Tax=Pichia membranifaciens NRRL Y-2026 TaxID=763406 RepID=A0A1E3NPE4_9ASCO|nr:hypothetical protein PICMEDRAFT_15513 [Pichia membranifaciens NRRL Y-2026]ODQ47578.1 hypothetical protein PICMEDRAFT_15513 [Pichia membranifaciens NRRL Y-2026]
MKFLILIQETPPGPQFRRVDARTPRATEKENFTSEPDQIRSDLAATQIELRR